jgi:RNA polymerase sigma-70 factor (ECF subfamily)
MIFNCEPNIASPISRNEEHFIGTTRIYTDDLLVELAKTGDLQAFESLIARYEPYIFKIVLRITRHHEDTEDVVQETVLMAYRHIQQFQGNSKFYTWLTSIAINQALMCLRKRRKSAISLAHPIQTEDGSMFLDLPDWRPNPEQECRRYEVMGRLRDSVIKLPRCIRAAFVLRHIYEFTTEETAAALGITVSAVKSRVLRARRQLRKRLKTPQAES